MTKIDPIALRARLVAQADSDTAPISDAQACTITALFGQYRLTPYQAQRADAAQSHRKVTNAERRAILGYLTGTIHTHDLTCGWYVALFGWLVRSATPVEMVTEQLRALLAAAEGKTQDE